MTDMKLTPAEACDALAQSFAKQFTELTGIAAQNCNVCLTVMWGDDSGQGMGTHMSTNFDQEVLGGLFITWLTEMRHRGQEIPKVS